MYRNLGWNAKIALYMAGRGIGWIGAPLLLLSYWIIEDSLTGGVVMAVVLVVSGGVPFARSLTGKVWVDDNHLCSRNAFRTIRHPLSDVSRITTRALWQNFFVVGAIESASRGPSRAERLIPVPAEDAGVLTAEIERIRSEEGGGSGNP